MYSLTDHTAQELSWMAEANAEKIEELTGIEKEYELAEPLGDSFSIIANSLLPGFLSSRRIENAAKLKLFREHNVHVLTALQIVRDREKVQSN